MIQMTRRAALVGLGCALTSSQAWAEPDQAELRLRRPATGEFLVIRNWPLTEVDHLRASLLLRDVKDAGEAVWVDPLLIETLARINVLADRLIGSATITITSGYRTIRHNSAVEGAAQNSFHTRGQAADYQIAGITAPACAQLAAMVGAGGIGLYDSFNHVDTGPDRTWDQQSRRIR
ncbi:YcbK family protein [Microvirga puerhi]|uniref:Murein endopeptidase K n=1 Tax=Microvirga puerhi TaxID=2876078 RepID=A0ABS7VUU3_9HYPH|nr:DUF882 domain-containing protein [Microvirga puerhi]MBZ6078916.1 DUF882 domain-containing protein [Microvirga puerhi]